MQNLSVIKNRMQAAVDPGVEIEKIIVGNRLGSLTILGSIIAPSLVFVPAFLIMVYQASPTGTLSNFFPDLLNMITDKDPNILMFGGLFVFLVIRLFISYLINRSKRSYFGISKTGITEILDEDVRVFKWREITSLKVRKTFFNSMSRTLIFKTTKRTANGKHFKVISMNDINDYPQVNQLHNKYRINK